MAYDTQAQELAFSLYARGWSNEKCVREMRKVYPGFAGSTYDEWVKKLDWPARRAVLDQKRMEFEELCQDTSRLLVLELNTIRKKLFDQIKAGTVDAQTVYAHARVAKQIAELTQKHLDKQDLLKLSMDLLTTAFETFLSRMRELDGMAPLLEKHAPQIGTMVAEIGEQFGEA